MHLLLWCLASIAFFVGTEEATSHSLRKTYINHIERFPFPMETWLFQMFLRVQHGWIRFLFFSTLNSLELDGRLGVGVNIGCATLV